MQEIYILNPTTYDQVDIIDEYQSIIWSERFIDPGDTKLAIPASPERLKLFPPGTLLMLNGSQEIMVLDTRSIESGILTVAGKTIEVFFDERSIDAMTLTDSPGVMLGQIVQAMQDKYASTSPIPRLEIGDTDDSLPIVTENIEAGPVHAALLTLAKKYNIDMHVKRASRVGGGFELRFGTRVGVDLTSDGPGALVRFSPFLENFANVKELYSDAGAKTVAVAFAPPGLSVTVDPVKISRVPNGYDVYQPFRERIVEVDMSDFDESELPSPATDEEKRAYLHDVMHDRALKTLRAAPERKKVFDGEVTPASQYLYYTEFDADGPDYRTRYRLGDLIEVGNYWGDIATGIVTEFIRSNNNAGSKNYPTVASPDEPIIDTGVAT